MKPKFTSYDKLQLSVIAFAVAGATPIVGAANIAWNTDAASGSFSATNWTSGTTIPAAGGTASAATGDALYFGTSATTVLNNDLVAAAFNGLTFNSGANAFTITGGAITLSGNIDNYSTALQSIGLNIALDANRAITATQGGGDLKVSGIISQIGANRNLAKNGSGTLTLSNANTYAGATQINTGTLALDFSAVGAPAANIIAAASALQTAQFSNNSATAALFSPASLVVAGLANAAGSQNFANTRIGYGASHINTSTSGTGTVTLGLGAIVRGSGSASGLIGPTVDFSIPAGVTVNASAGAGAGVGTDNVLSSGSPFATVNGNTWATLSAGVISGLATYSASYATAGVNLDVSTSGNTLSAAPQTIRFNTPGASVLNLGGNRIIPGILLTGAVGASETTISGNQLQPVSNRDFTIFQNNIAGPLVINSNVVANGSGGLAKAGLGTVIAKGTYTITGGNWINEGTLILDTAASTPGTFIVSREATLQLGNNDALGSFTNAAPPFVRNDGTFSFKRTDTALVVSNAISGSGSISQDGSGTTTLVGTQSYTGPTKINAG
ncbi:MAG: autotransporter-associated beta strand repeat-containing protein, partial [Opitutaceae bacterium]|nr:autotransporter-associated beta strand repeat-containing protein [Verrucomicrobiales bacterium]